MKTLIIGLLTIVILFGMTLLTSTIILQNKEVSDIYSEWQTSEKQKNAEIESMRVSLTSQKKAWKVYAIKKNVKINKPKLKSLTLSEVAQQVMSGVVHIKCPQKQGSGFVIGPNLIATARHVIKGIGDFEITTSDNHRLHATRAISSKNHDVGFIWIDDLVCINDCEVVNSRAINVLQGEHEVLLRPLELGSIKDCVLGQDVFVIGSPLGKMNFNSLTAGVISGIDRKWEITNSWTGEDYGWEVAFTTDSAGHLGNSGCPLFSMDGKVRGILVGGRLPVLICIMPCDLFLSDLNEIKSMFEQDRYQREIIVPTDNNYTLLGSGFGK